MMKITLFGFAWSGTTTIAKMLCEKLDYTFMSTWNIFRQYAQDAGMSVYEFENTIAKHDPNFDIKLDTLVKEYWVSNDNFVFESRLAWHFIPDSMKVYLDCEREERYRRIQEREKGKLEDIVFFNTRREEELEKRYHEIYPDITFPPLKESFDIYLDVTDMHPDRIVEVLVEKIKKWDSTS